MYKRFKISNRVGAYIRWYFNGWHHFMFSDRYEISDQQITNGVQVTELFSQISRVEQPTSKEVKKYIQVGHQLLSGDEYDGLKNILLSEVVELYIYGLWHEIRIDRSTYNVKGNRVNGYSLEFTAQIMDSDIESELMNPPSEVTETSLPTLTTKTASAVTEETFWTGGENLTNYAGCEEYGAVYREQGESTWSEEKITARLSASQFSVKLEGLTLNTTYEYKAFIVLNGNRYYGQIKSQTTRDVPEPIEADTIAFTVSTNGSTYTTGTAYLKLSGSTVYTKAVDTRGGDSYKFSGLNELEIYSLEFGTLALYDDQDNVLTPVYSWKLSSDPSYTAGSETDEESPSTTFNIKVWDT